MVMMCHNKGLPIFRRTSPPTQRRARTVGCALRARKSPAGERGSSEVNRFSTTGLPPGGASVMGKMTRALALAGPLTKRRAEPLVSVSEGRHEKAPPKRGSSMAYGEGLDSLAAEPRSPAPKTWVIRAGYRGGKWAKYQKPRRGCRRGLGWQRRGGSLPKLAMGQRGIGGDVLSTSRLTI